MLKNFYFSSESVSEGHADKVADYISDSILDACLVQDPLARVACEVLVKGNGVFLAGEITTKAIVNYEEIVRNAIREIGYTYEDNGFHADKVHIHNMISPQSLDISQAISAKQYADKPLQEQGAGDQGIMFGYACEETPELMPAPIMFAHSLTKALAAIRRTGCLWVRPDCKSQVGVLYENGSVKSIKNIVISVQHSSGKTHREIEKFCIDEVIKQTLPLNLLDPKIEYFINPSGRFIQGGPETDAGLTGRKIMVDTYGSWGKHGGGAFSGKDSSKVDRSAAYMCRWVAKNIVGISHSV